MAPLAGLTSLSAPQVTDQGVLEAHSIGGIHDDHGTYGSRAEPWPASYGLGYAATAYGPEADQGTHPAFNQPGIPGDRTPSAHRAPYPRGIQQVTNDQQSFADVASSNAAQRSLLHGRDLGAVRVLLGNSQTGREVPAHYTTDRYEAPNGNILGRVAGQVAGTGSALKDPDQGFGALNSLDEFTRGHSIRRVQHDTLHWDRSLTYAPPQPFWGRHEIRETRFDGPDSPYSVLGDTSTGQQVVWEGRIGDPTAYVQPAEPTVKAPSQGTDVWAYGW